MRWRFIWLGIILVAASAGCTPPTALERKAGQLKPGLTETNVTTLFAGFEAHDAGWNPVLRSSTVLFQSNFPYGKLVSYSPTNFGFLDQVEYCEVYFDQNGIIIGYSYLRDDGRRIDGKPRR